MSSAVKSNRFLKAATMSTFLVFLACGQGASFSGDYQESHQNSSDSIARPGFNPEYGAPPSSSRNSDPQIIKNSEAIVFDQLPPPIISIGTPEEIKVKSPMTIKRRFYTTKIENQFLFVNTPERYIIEKLTLKELPPAQSIIKQIERPVYERFFVQGHQGIVRDKETFQLSEASTLDILLIIDDSSSMENEHLKLAPKLSSLLESIQNSDWQMRIITTSSPCPRNGRILKAGDFDLESAFSAAVTVPIKRGVAEKGLPMGIRGLEGECLGIKSPWLRNNSSIAILILSDEENCGSPNGDGCPNELGESPQDMIQFLANLRPDGRAKFYGLIEGPFDPCGVDADEAREYHAVIEATGGIYGSICDDSYDETLKAISSNVRKTLHYDFHLKYQPTLDSLEVRIDGNLLEKGISLREKTLTLEQNVIDPQAQTLSVRYRSDPQPRFSELQLDHAIDPESLVVLSDHKPLPNDTFQYDAEKKIIRFSSIPSDRSVVKIYAREGFLNRYFSLEGLDILGSPLSIHERDQPIHFRYDIAKKHIELSKAPADGTSITIYYRTSEGQILSYPIPLSDIISQPIARDAIDGTELAVHLDGNNLIFRSEDVHDGRQIRVIYDFAEVPRDLSLILDHNPLPGSLEIYNEQGQSLCDEILQDKVLNLNCTFNEADRFVVRYQYIQQWISKFSINDSFDPEKAHWQVWLDELPFYSFSRQGHEISVALDKLSFDTEVVIAVTFFP